MSADQKSRAKVSRIHIMKVKLRFDKPVTMRDARLAIADVIASGVVVSAGDVFGQIDDAVHTGKVGS